jgi:hypothetical protein
MSKISDDAGADIEERAPAPAPVVIDMSQQYVCFVLQFASMSAVLRLLYASATPLPRPHRHLLLPQMRGLLVAPARRLSALGGAAVVFIALKLTPFAFGMSVKSARRVTSGIAR